MLSRIAATRGYATAAASATRSSSFVAPSEEKVTRLSNGITIGSIDNQGPVSQYVIAYRAGTRYEQADEAGLVHHLRHAIGTDSQNYLGVKLLWQNGSIGGTLTASSDRDLFLVHLSAVSPDLKITFKNGTFLSFEIILILHCHFSRNLLSLLANHGILKMFLQA